jgi:hypothetical protein
MIAYIQQYLRERLDREGDRFNWRLPLYALLVALIVFIPAAICDSLILYIFVSIPLLSIIAALLIYAATGKKLRRCLSIVSMLVIYCAISVVLIVYDVKNSSAIRWWVWSHGYKARTLAQPASANGELKHVEWDGWGWAGQDTTVYLVFDPADSLSAAAISHQPGKFNGIPCEVYLVRRLESHWYSVQFYTDEFWGRRNALNCGGV